MYARVQLGTIENAPVHQHLLHNADWRVRLSVLYTSREAEVTSAVVSPAGGIPGTAGQQP